MYKGSVLPLIILKQNLKRKKKKNHGILVSQRLLVFDSKEKIKGF